ncbi:hypothetical protein GF343_04475 [Candidatus Woesearchaeota archaeon]|nr:hypothetical protein [Candidatus Woesearchaeota archaeon]
MAKKHRNIIAIIVLIVFIAVFLMLFLAPANTGNAVQMPPIEDKFRMYFLASALVNNQANKGIHQAELDSMRHGRLEKTPQEYLGCKALLSNIQTLKEARTVIMNDFNRLAEMNCFFAVSDADLKKFRLLEEQCRSKEFNTELPSEIKKIYDYQKKALNTGCMKQSGLQELLRTTKLIVTEKSGRTQIKIQK